MDCDTLILTVLNLSLCLIEIALKYLHSFLLIADSVLVVSLLSGDIVFKCSCASLKIGEDLLQDLIVTLSCLMILNFISVSVDNAIASIIWGGDWGSASTKRAASNW